MMNRITIKIIMMMTCSENRGKKVFLLPLVVGRSNSSKLNLEILLADF